MAAAKHRINQPDAGVAAVAVAFVGVLSAVALAFAPVVVEQTVVRWPAAGGQAVSSSALFAPYRPAELTVSAPCRVLRAASQPAGPVTVFSTDPSGDGVTVRTDAGVAQVLVGGRIEASVPLDATDCSIMLHAAPDNVTMIADGRTEQVSGPVPKVIEFSTDLSPQQAAGLSAAARTSGPFASTPSMLKRLLIVVNIAAVLAAMVLLARSSSRRGLPRRRPPAPSRRRIALGSVDGFVIAALAVWAIVGPLAVDDGWAATIARTVTATGDAGNYYRWWNASETPFALSQQLLAPLTQVSIAPLWLRLPSTVLGIGTWWVLTRFVLSAALPRVCREPWLRMLAAVCFLVAWLPYNLGTRPESYVAFGVTSVLALWWRARTPVGLGWATLLAAITIPISPTSVIVAAPLVVFAPRALRTLKKHSDDRRDVVGLVALLLCVGSITITLIFADQTWDGLVTATEWHRQFGPSLEWYHEPDRYHYLLGNDQQGSAAKRLPVLLSAAMLPIVLALFTRRTGRTRAEGSALRLAGTIMLALALLAFVPSKWSYHLGAFAGLFTSFLVVASVTLARRSQTLPCGRRTAAAAIAGGVLLSGAVAFAFSGPNAWWLDYLYRVPWASGPATPMGVPLNSVWLWLAVLVIAGVVLAALPAATARSRIERALVCSPVAVLVAGAIVMVTLLLVSFVTAPSRQPAGSLARANLRWLRGEHSCGLADDVEVLQERDVLTPVGPSGASVDFADSSGSPTELSPWFALPALEANDVVALGVSGNIDRPNRLLLEFGRANPAAQVDTPDFGIEPVAQIAVPDRKPIAPDLADPSWRSIGVDATAVPAGADRVRIVATVEKGRLEFTRPRLRTAVPMTEFLANHGPVLVSWPLAFLFPCVDNIAQVADGLASMPRTVIVSPDQWYTTPTDQTIGGTFAGLEPLGRLYELSTRLSGRTDIDWGGVVVAGPGAPGDNYDTTVRLVTRSGI